MCRQLPTTSRSHSQALLHNRFGLFVAEQPRGFTDGERRLTVISKPSAELLLECSNRLQVLRRPRIDVADPGEARKRDSELVGDARRLGDAGTLRELEPNDSVPGAVLRGPRHEPQVAAIAV